MSEEGVSFCCANDNKKDINDLVYPCLTEITCFPVKGLGLEENF
jgi:hypothetical protein